MIGFITIAIGAWSEVENFPEFSGLGLALVAGSLSLAILCPIFSAVLAKEERFLVAEVTKLLADKNDGRNTDSGHQEVKKTKGIQANVSLE